MYAFRPIFRYLSTVSICMLVKKHKHIFAIQSNDLLVWSMRQNILCSLFLNIMTSLYWSYNKKYINVYYKNITMLMSRLIFLGWRVCLVKHAHLRNYWIVKFFFEYSTYYIMLATSMSHISRWTLSYLATEAKLQFKSS